MLDLKGATSIGKSKPINSGPINFAPPKDFINLVNQKLRPDGIFYFKTDWSHYFTEAKKLLLDNQHWQLLRKEDLGNTLKNLPQTSFEKKALSVERELNELILKKLI